MRAIKRLPVIARQSVRKTVDRGASAVEYGLMVAAIAATIVGVVFALGGFVQSAFKTTCDTIAAAPAGDGTTTLGDGAAVNCDGTKN